MEVQELFSLSPQGTGSATVEFESWRLVNVEAGQNKKVAKGTFSIVVKTKTKI